MKDFNAFYQYINMLSLDVVAGAVISSLFFSKILDADVSLFVLASLALTVWIIYTIDHLRDARIIPHMASTDRHRFHQRNFSAVLFVLVIALLVDLALIWFIPEKVLHYGFVLGLWVLVYLVFQRYLKFLKECFVACLYTGGILLPSLAMTNLNLAPVHYIMIAQFCLTALINLLLFSLFDYEQDRNHQQHSFVTWFGVTAARKGILAFAMLNMLIAIGMWPVDARLVIIFLVMNMLLMTILLFEERFVSNNYYRIMGDAIFFIPVCYLL